MPDAFALVPLRRLRSRELFACPMHDQVVPAVIEVGKPDLDPPLAGPDLIYLCHDHFEEFLERAQPIGVGMKS